MNMIDYETGACAEERLELRTWLRLLTCCRMMERDIRQKLREECMVTLPQFDLLAALARAPDGLVMGDLSKRLMVTNGNVTALVERLVRDGMVERTVSPTDRRALVVCLTEKGWDVFNTVAPRHRAWIDDMMRGLPRQTVEVLYMSLADLKASVAARRSE